MNKTFLMCIFLFLTGCAMNQPFDCPYKEGARCLSVGEVDKKIDANRMEGTNTEKKKNRSPFFSWFNTQKNELPLPESSNLPHSPLRTPEAVLSLWVAPYYTTDGAYHEARHIHFVAREASWVGVSEIEEHL